MFGRQKHRMNNKGAALVTVIVVVAFLSAIGTIILYASANNFYMKTTDIKTKENFYDGERGFEEFRALVMKDVNEAFEYAYYEAMKKYTKNSTGDTRESEFCTRFFDKFTTLFAAHRDNYQNELEAKYSPASATLTFANPNFVQEAGSERRILQGVEFTYDDASGYRTIISTDLVLIAPDLDWSIDKSLSTYEAGDDATSLPSTDPADRFKTSKYLYFENWMKK